MRALSCRHHLSAQRMPRNKLACCLPPTRLQQRSPVTASWAPSGQLRRPRLHPVQVLPCAATSLVECIAHVASMDTPLTHISFHVRGVPAPLPTKCYVSHATCLTCPPTSPSLHLRHLGGSSTCRGIFRRARCSCGGPQPSPHVPRTPPSTWGSAPPPTCAGVCCGAPARSSVAAWPRGQLPDGARFSPGGTERGWSQRQAG